LFLTVEDKKKEKDRQDSESKPDTRASSSKTKNSPEYDSSTGKKPKSKKLAKQRNSIRLLHLLLLLLFKQ